MKAICVKDVEISGVEAYSEGEIYDAEKVGDMYEVMSPYGVGAFEKKDKTFKKSFVLETDSSFKKELKKLTEKRVKEQLEYELGR